MSLLHWYYANGLKGALTLASRFFVFFWRFFNIAHLLRTIISPWKRDVTIKNWRGFSFNRLFTRLVSNILSRFIGAIVRILTIALGLFCIAVYSVFALAVLLLWLIFPFLLVLTPFTILTPLPTAVLVALASIVTIFLIFVVYAYILSKKPVYSDMDLDHLQHLPWFARIHDRLELSQDQRDTPLFDDMERFQKILAQKKLSADDFSQLLSWEVARQIEIHKKPFWTKDTLNHTAPIGQFWNFAYTPHLDAYCIDISSSHLDASQTIFIGNKDAYHAALVALMRPNQNSILLVGDAGIGKMSFIYNLARNIREQVFLQTPLARKRMLLFNPAEAITYASNHSISVEGFLRTLFLEAAHAGNVILIIQDMAHHTSVRDGGEAVNITSVLSEFLSIPTFQVIATASANDYHDYIARNQILMKSFEKIEFQEMPKTDAVHLLLEKLESIEDRRIIFSFRALQTIVNLSSQYNASMPLPERAMDLIEKILLTRTKAQADTVITAGDIEAFVSKATGIPLGNPDDTEREKLLDFESILHKRIIGQKEAVTSIAETVRKVRAGITESNRPLASFLFLGPTGVGKTETAKAFAESYFGNETKMIRFDMSEFQGETALKRFVGSRSEHIASRIASAVKDTPHSILLLDEIEKAEPKVLDIFLQILDEGFFTDDFGDKINFRNTIIIATSNAGAAILAKMIEDGTDYATMRKKIINHITEENVFRMEFLNRFNGIILFHPLDAEELRSVTTLMLDTIATSVRVKKNIAIRFETGCIQAIIDNGYEPIFGARSIRRYIETHIENIIATKIIAKETAEGETILIRPEDMQAK
ncbi:MAG: AAA family ATPase [Candidatus Moranbacteria bacterium]|nr:AAA family ATPase [Candidatus Moranbacteria bacterium]